MRLQTLDPRVSIDQNGCHNWTGALLPHGYGTISIDGVTLLAHRWAYETQVGPIPDGLHIDHMCRNRRCINPAHLEPVTQAENNRRAAAAAVCCRRGHVRTASNTRIEGGFRRCIECRAADQLERGRRYRAKNQDRINEKQRQYRARQKAAV